MATDPTVHDSVITLLNDMSFWSWFAAGEVLFVGRFAEAHHLPGAPVPNVIEICLNLDDKTRVQRPARHMALIMPNTRFAETIPPGKTIIDKLNQTQITFIDACTLLYRPPMVPLSQAKDDFQSAIADPIDLIALGICEVAARCDNNRDVVARTITSLTERIITSDSPLLMFSDTQRDLALGNLRHFVYHSGKGMTWWKRRILPKGPSMTDRVLARLDRLWFGK